MGRPRSIKSFCFPDNEYAALVMRVPTLHYGFFGSLGDVGNSPQLVEGPALLGARLIALSMTCWVR